MTNKPKIDPLTLLAGIDIPIPSLSLIIHPLTLKEIAMMGEEKFFIVLQFLLLKKENYFQDKKVLQQLTNFQVFMTILNENMSKYDIEINLKQEVENLMNLIFPNYQIYFTPQSIILKMKDSKGFLTIDENNFDTLQDVLRLVFSIKEDYLGEGGAYNPEGRRAKEIAEKLMQGRQKVAMQKKGTGGTVFTKYVSILAVGLHLSINELINYTPYQIYDLLERYNLYTAWDIDMRVRMAGGDPKSEPESFMKDIH